MDALILVGGYATRLQPLTLRTPKSLVPVAGKPALGHLLDRLREAGAREVLISLNPIQKKVEDFFGDGKAYGIKVSYHYEQHRKEEHKPGAIGAIMEAVEEYGAPKMGLVLGGDNYVWGLDLREMVKLREKRKAAAVLAFYDLSNKSLVEQYGIAALNEDGRVTTFQEKPRVEDAVSKLASTAFYACSGEFLTKHIPAYVEAERKAGKKPDRLGDLFKHYTKGLPIYGLPFQGVWGDANNAETYVELNKLAMNHLVANAKGKGSGVGGAESMVAKDAQIAIGAVIRGPVIIESGCTIGNNAVVGPYTHLLSGVEVGENAFVTGSVVFERAKIGEGAHIQDSLIDGETIVGPHCRIENYSILGYKSVLGAHSRVLGNSRIWPYIQAGEESVLEGVFKAALSEQHERELEGSRYWKD